MTLRTLTLLLFNASFILFSFSSSADDFDPEPVINELSLKTSGAPLSVRSDWAPRKVLATLMPADPELLEQYKQALQDAAGDVQLTIAGRGGFRPTRESLKDYDAIIGLCTQQLLAIAGPNLRWMHNYSVGMDWCTGASKQQLEEVVFTNNKRLSAPAIAEHTVAMLLSITRNLPAYQAAQRNGDWQRSGDVVFGELTGKTMLIAGLGGIGTEIARRANGLGMRVIATRNSSRNGPDFVEYVGLSDELNTLAKRADVVVNALPLTEATTGLFNKPFFEAVKPGAIFLSVGRGKSTVTQDLIAALDSGRLFGAGLDVTDPEPLPRTSPLWTMDNVIITPHVSASGIDSKRRSFIIAVENLRRYVAGEALLNVVDLQRGY